MAMTPEEYLASLSQADSQPSNAAAPAPSASPSAAGPSSVSDYLSQISAKPDVTTPEDTSKPGATPDNALDVSPVSIADRFKIGIGNQAGSLAYLKKNYDDATVNKDGHMVVKKGGKWHQVDPGGLGGGGILDKVAEGMSDVADLGDVAANAIGTAAGAFAGGATTLGAGAVAGAAAGGGLAAYGRIQFAKKMGTYQATPEDELKDIGLEALLSVGGEAGAKYLAKPLLSKVGDALKSFTSAASDGSKAAMSAVLQATAGLRKDSADLLMKDAAGVMGELDAAKAAAKGAADSVPLSVSETLKQRTGGYVGALFDKPRRALSSVFDKAENEMLASVPKGFKAEPGSLVRDSMNDLVERGFAKPLTNKSGEVVGYGMAPAADILQNLQHAEANGALNQKVLRDLKSFIDLGNKHLNSGTLQGADAVESLVNIRRGFDKFYYSATRANPVMKEVLTPTSAGLRNNLVKSIGNAGTEVATKYANMNKMYSDMLPHVAEADRIQRLYNGKNAFINRLMSDDAGNAKNLINTMASLKGDAGKGLADKVAASTAAQDFVSKAPQISLKTGDIPASIAKLPVAPLTSPRAVGRGAQAAQQVLPYAQQFGSFLKALPPQQMKQLIAHPDAFAKLVQGTALAGHQEQAMTQQLLQQHGVVPPGAQ